MAGRDAEVTVGEGGQRRGKRNEWLIGPHTLKLPNKKYSTRALRQRQAQAGRAGAYG